MTPMEAAAPPMRQYAGVVGPLTWLGRPFRGRSWLMPFLAHAAVMVIGFTAHELHWWWWLALLAIPFFGCAGVAFTGGEKFCDSARLYMFLYGIGGASYVFYCTIWDPYYEIGPWIAWTASLVLDTAWWVALVKPNQLDHEKRLRSRGGNGGPNPLVELETWQKRFGDLGAQGVRLREKKMLDNGSLALLFELPEDGSVLYSRIQNMDEGLETASGLPSGSVRMAQKRDTQGRPMSRMFYLYIDMENVLSQTIYDEDDSDEPLSVYDAFCYGKLANGEPAVLTMREISILIAAVTRRGKTNLLNIILRRLTRCRDAWVCGIDLKRRIFKPWLKPFFEGWPDEDTGRPIERPGLGYIATTRAEAYWMLYGLAHGVIQYRSGADLSGSDKTEPSENVAAIFCIVDELPMLVGTHSGPKYADPDKWIYNSAMFSDLFTIILNTGSSEAVNVIGVTQRPTVTMSGSGDSLGGYNVKMCLGLESDQDAQLLFGTGAGKKVARYAAQFEGVETRGALVVQGAPDAPVLPAKVFRQDPDEVPHIAFRHTWIWPDLDAGTEDAWDAAIRELTDGRYGFTDRWDEERVRHMMQPGGRFDPHGRPGGVPPAPSAGRPNGGGAATTTLTSTREESAFAGALAMADGLDSTGNAEPDDEAQDDQVADLDPDFARVIAEAGGAADLDAAFESVINEIEAGNGPAETPTPPELEDLYAQAYRAMIQFVRDRKRKGAVAGVIRAYVFNKYGAQAPDQATIYRWLKRATCNRGKDPGKAELVQPVLRGAYFAPEYER